MERSGSMKKLASFFLLTFFFGFCGCSSNNTLINKEGRQATIAPLDQAKTTAAQTALQSNPDLAPLHLMVKVYGNTAILTGTVKTETQKEEAEALLGKVDGIDKVDDELQVSP
jgi:osmotically-inducible protein OsmY